MPVVALAVGHTPRVLIAEDNAVAAEDLRAGLIAAGVEVLGPVRGLAGALDLLAMGPAPTAAILAISLGGQAVYPLADTLRGRGIPFVLTTVDARSIPAAYAGVPCCEKPYRVEHCLGLLFEPAVQER